MSGRPAADTGALLRTLRTSPVFRGGTPESLAALVERATPLSYSAGAFLCRQGEPAAHVFVLTKGEVAIVSPARSGAEQVLGIAGQGELLGELALLANGRRTAGIRRPPTPLPGRSAERPSGRSWTRRRRVPRRCCGWWPSGWRRARR